MSDRPRPHLTGGVELVYKTDPDGHRAYEEWREKLRREWGPGAPEEPPSWLRDEVETVLADLQHPRAIALDVLYGRERARGETCWAVYIRESGELGGVSFTIEPEEQGAILLARLADYLQEQFFPETRGAWGEARPACPGHAHPAVASFDEDTDVAWWSCPSTGADLIQIGHYGELLRR